MMMRVNSMMKTGVFVTGGQLKQKKNILEKVFEQIYCLSRD